MGVLGGNGWVSHQPLLWECLAQGGMPLPASVEICSWTEATEEALLAMISWVPAAEPYDLPGSNLVPTPVPGSSRAGTMGSGIWWGWVGGEAAGSSEVLWPWSTVLNVSSISLEPVTRGFQGDWQGFCQDRKSSPFAVLTHKEMQDEILAARSHKLKDKLVFQRCWVGRQRREECGEVEVSQKK